MSESLKGTGMFKSTLCYLRNNGKTLMLHRNKKPNDVNEGKWIGVGGKFEGAETAGECLIREVREETGIELSSYVFHGIIYFRNDEYEDEEMYLYSARITDGQAETVMNGTPCSEGTLKFIPDDEIMGLSLWEGDRFFLNGLLDGKKRISYDLTYEKGKLVSKKTVPVKNILFDLDGTLLDTGEGIMKCAQYALKTIGVEVEDYHDLSFFVGPPLVYTYTRRYGLDMDKARELVKIYRERYEPEGVFECEPYPGVRECLEGLRSDGYRLYVCSSKPEHMCRKLMKHFDMTDFFDDIVGSTPDGRIDTKSQVLHELFRRNASEDPYFIGSSVLVGDTKFDIAGASDTGISSVGVSFGYGDTEEMKDLGAAAIAGSMSEINDTLFRFHL
ncbi:MAG: HAD hydrolase-like protein [Lachnospiraceae bacterium]|nr:HAD hydrolase-like protein [Lachnospiraceae bacterium]